MMDMLILLAVFIAILALAYFTYRNLVGLDTRLRKIEQILQNAEVVTTTDPSLMPSAQNHPSHSSQQSHTHEYSAFVSPEYIAGWGGQGPVLKVEKESDDHENEDDKVIELDTEQAEEEQVDEDEEGEELDTEQPEEDNGLDLELEGESAKKDDAMNSVEEILQSMENDRRQRQTDVSGGSESVSRGPKVSDMKDALKKAGINVPANAKKSDLQKLMEEHHIQV
jgi:hypothetical protein